MSLSSLSPVVVVVGTRGGMSKKTIKEEGGDVPRPLMPCPSSPLSSLPCPSSLLVLTLPRRRWRCCCRRVVVGVVVGVGVGVVVGGGGGGGVVVVVVVGCVAVAVCCGCGMLRLRLWFDGCRGRFRFVWVTRPVT